MDLRQRIRATLYGQALGDAWAMPVYFTMEQTRQKFGEWIDTFLPAPDDHPVHKGLIAGRVTDDSEQAFAIAESIIAQGAVTVRGVADALIAWYDRVDGDNSPYVGPSTRRGVTALKRGADPNTTGTWGDTNGAAMRVSVVGTIHPGDLNGAIESACVSAIPTHNTSVGFAGAAAVAGAVAVALGGASLDAVIRAGIEGAERGHDRGRPWLAASLSRRIKLAVNIAQGGGTPRAKLREMYAIVGTSLAITESVAAAFGVVALANGDPVWAAKYAAALSGDADTIGAIACAICGAYAAIIPADIEATLRAANPEYDFEALTDGLFRVASR